MTEPNITTQDRENTRFLQQTAQRYIPLVIGTTGHTDLRDEDLPTLEARVSRIFKLLRRYYPHTPLLLLSSLNEGADRLIVRVGRHYGARLVVALPPDEERCRSTAPNAESEAELADLLGQAEQVICPPLIAGDTQEIAAYVARHAHLLIALWDDLPPGAPLEVGPVFWIPTPRQANPIPAASPFRRRTLFGESHANRSEALATYHALLQGVNGFNREVAQAGPEFEAQLTESVRELFTAPRRIALKKGERKPEPQRELATAADEDLEGSLQLIVHRYAVADALAIRAQGRRHHSVYALIGYLLAGALVLNLTDTWGSVLLFYLVVLVLGWRRYRQAEKTGQEKHLNYRSLAEAMRVLFFWRLAGVSEPAAHAYQYRTADGPVWMAQALRAWDLPDARLPQSNLPAVQQLWVEKDLSRHAHGARRTWGWVNHGWQVNSLLVAGAVVAAVALGLRVAYVAHFADLQTLLRLALATAPALAAWVELWTDRKAAAMLARQSKRITGLYQRASQQLKAALVQADTEKARQVISLLGWEALQRNSEWVLLHRNRE